MLFSQTTGGFYSPEIHGIHIPADAVEITDTEHARLLAGQTDGKQIVADEHGYPALQDPSPPSSAQLRTVALAEIEQRRDEALRAGVVLNGARYHTDETFLTELLGLLMGYQVGIYSGTQDIRTMDNTIVQLTVQEITAVAAAVGVHRKAVYAQSWAEKDALQ